MVNRINAMAIPISTNGTVTSRKSVTLSNISVSGFTPADVVESASATKDPFYANTVDVNTDNILTRPTTLLTGVNVGKYTIADTVESVAATKDPFYANTVNVNTDNILGQPITSLSGIDVGSYTIADTVESKAVTKLPFRSNVPNPLSPPPGGFSGEDLLVIRYIDERWTTD